MGEVWREVWKDSGKRKGGGDRGKGGGWRGERGEEEGATVY